MVHKPNENPRGGSLWGFLCFYGSLHRLDCAAYLSLSSHLHM